MLSKQSFPETGLVRLSAILAPDGPIPVSKSTWWAGVRSGRFPKPVKLGPRTTTWRAEDVRALFEGQIDGYAVQDPAVFVRHDADRWAASERGIEA